MVDYARYNVDPSGYQQNAMNTLLDSIAYKNKRGDIARQNAFAEREYQGNMMQRRFENEMLRAQSNREQSQIETKLMGVQADVIKKALENVKDPQSWGNFKTWMGQIGQSPLGQGNFFQSLLQSMPQEYDQNGIKEAIGNLGTLTVKSDEKEFTLSPGQVRFSGTGKRIASVAKGPEEAPSDLRKFEQVTGTKPGLRGTPEYEKAYLQFQQDVAAQKIKIYDEQVKKIGDAIRAGKQPPEIKGFGMSKIAPQLKAYLADTGYNQSRAVLDWKATEKHITQLNGAQQLRLRQAVTFTKDSLNKIEELAGQWAAGRFPVLNKLNLKAAMNGAYGANAQSIATQLKTQIADLTSELATVYKGGNSSTDESLRLAAENLKAEWSYDQMVRNVDLIRENLKYRENSLIQVGVAGVPGGSRYSGKAEAPQEPKTTPSPQIRNLPLKVTPGGTAESYLKKFEGR